MGCRYKNVDVESKYNYITILPFSQLGQSTQSLSARQASQGSLKVGLFLFAIDGEESPDVMMILCYRNSEEEKTKTEMNKDMLTRHTARCKVN